MGLRGLTARVRCALLAVSAAVLALAAGCSAPLGIYHRVEPGQSAYRIARAYDVPLVELLDANGIADPSLVRPGQWVWVPGATGTRPVPRADDLGEQLSPIARRAFRPPLRGKIGSAFGPRNAGFHRGVDILAPEGSDVRASEYGLVLYAGNGLRGYGNVIVLDHGEGITTLYGHLKEFRVESGDAVAAGQVIGTVGRTGNATTSHLHFELRLEDEALDPERYVGEEGGTR
ncbi:MAG: LysM peptidoglycan-binding domain-containing M23 family metallopeptidase [Gemmatimonadota bacterium]